MADIVERLRAPAYRLVMDSETVRADMAEAADEIERLRKALSACAGFMLNAKIDLETRTPKRTTLNTLEGGIRLVKCALTTPDRSVTDEKAG